MRIPDKNKTIVNNMEEELFTVVNVKTGQKCGEIGFPSDPRPLKRLRLNPIGEDIYLLPDGSIKKDEDSIVFLQRIWKHKAYTPGTGCMYLKTLSSFTCANLGQDRTG
jgi:hypothetical protein